MTKYQLTRQIEQAWIDRCYDYSNYDLKKLMRKSKAELEQMNKNLNWFRNYIYSSRNK